MKIGDKIVIATDERITGRGTITKVRVDNDLTMFWTDNQHKAEDCIMSYFAWPAAAEPQLQAAIDARRAAKKAYDDTMAAFYVIRNACIRGEIA